MKSHVESLRENLEDVLKSPDLNPVQRTILLNVIAYLQREIDHARFVGPTLQEIEERLEALERRTPTYIPYYAPFYPPCWPTVTWTVGSSSGTGTEPPTQQGGPSS